MNLATLTLLPRLFARITGLLILFTGVFVLLGWVFDLPSFKSIVPSWPKMAPNSALSFVLAGFGLWCGATTTALHSEMQVRDNLAPSWRTRAMRLCGAAVTFIGLLKICELIGGWNVTEHLWFHEQDSSALPARMPPAAALDFTLMGIALMLAAGRQFIGAFQFLTIFGGIIGWLGLSYYLYGGEPLTPYGQMAIHTAGAFLGLSGGLLCLRADGGLMALLVSDSAGGDIARRLVPSVLFVPIILGWLRLQGQRAGWFGTEAGVALLTLASGLVFGGLIWANANLLHRTDSRRKIAEEQLLHLNSELEERVRNRTAELTSANEELEIFTYSVAHDLRAPLRHIEAFSKILSEGLDVKTSPDTQLCLDSIRRGTARMAQLVDDLLKLAQITRLELALQPTALVPLVESLIHNLKSETEGRAIKWQIHPLPVLEVDPGLIKQVFSVLISNAVKFSRTRATALIEVGCLSDESHVVLFVRDNGVGFDMAYADKLFGVFQRLHHADQFEGTGVGLAAAERIVRRHGGRIWAEASIDQGATFYFTIGSPQNATPLHSNRRGNFSLSPLNAKTS